MESSDVTAIIPTASRPTELTDTIQSLLAQSTPPKTIIVVASEGADVAQGIQENPNITLLFDAGSSARKRNLALSHVKGKYVFFLDDDIELHPAYLSEATALLDDFPAIVGFSGKLLKDGNVSRAEARELIHRWRHQEHWRGRLRIENRSTQFHGSNLIIRRSVLMRESFDERLPAYSLGEDYDLWVRAKRYGLTGRYDRCIAVHLRASGGRLSARKMAYLISQIIGILFAREFPLSLTLGPMLASWRSVLSFLSCPSSKSGGHDQEKNCTAIRRQSAMLSEAAHAQRE